MKALRFIALVCLCAALAAAQVAVGISPVARQVFLDANGVPVAGGKVCTFTAGTNTPSATYTDSTGNTQNSNPITLDSSGSPTAANIFLAAHAYKIALYGSLGADNNCPNAGPLIWTVDGVSNIGLIIQAQGPFVQNGNAFGALATIGTTDAQDFRVLANSVELARFKSGGSAQFSKWVDFLPVSPAVSAALTGRFYYDQATNHFYASENGGAAFQISFNPCTGAPGTTNVVCVGGNTVGATQTLGSTDAFDWRVMTAGVERLRVGGGNTAACVGCVGLNTQIPATLFHMAAAGTAELTVQSNAGNAFVDFDTAGPTVTGQVGIVAAGPAGTILWNGGKGLRILAASTQGDAVFDGRIRAGLATTDLVTAAGSIVSADVIASATATVNASVVGMQAGGGGNANVFSNKSGGGTVLDLTLGAPTEVLRLTGPSSATGLAQGTARFQHTVMVGTSIFASLPSAATYVGGILLCTDCKKIADGATAGSVAVGGGTGAHVASDGTNWYILY